MLNTEKYFNLYDFGNEKDINELLAIIRLFNLDDILLESLITVDQDSNFLNLGNSFKLNIVKTGKRLLSKKAYHEIRVEFLGTMIEDLIKLAANEGISLYIASVEDERVEMILNDNDHNHITYSKSAYNVDEIKDKIKNIRKNRN